LSWTVEFDAKVERELKKLDKNISKKILRYIDERIMQQEDPRVFGKELRGTLGGLWRYRVENYRIICKLEDDRMLVLVVRIGHRKNIYV